jgi:hypothetical protein
MGGWTPVGVGRVFQSPQLFSMLAIFVILFDLVQNPRSLFLGLKL